MDVSQGKIPFPPLNPTDIRAIKPALCCEPLLRPPLLASQLPEACTKSYQDISLCGHPGILPPQMIIMLRTIRII